ncbi:MAG TPA: M23 family metallopeptidase [Dissulfurispiraceae bacterium]|nr:M23 family metallopeptidase [Dissulfurispiraceae bacterium]
MIKFFGHVVLFAFFTISPAISFAMHADVVPGSLLPGDVFIVKITGFGTSAGLTASFEGTGIPLENCGQDCLSGIGVVSIDTKPGERRVIVTSEQERAESVLTVGSPKFPELHLTLPESKVTLSAEALARVRKEDAMLDEIWKKNGLKLFRENFVMPLPNQITTVFGAKRIMNGKSISIHKGIDVKGKLGERVAASNSGRVVLAEDLFFGGNTVIVDHGTGIYTIYMHLSKFAVKTGDVVEKGAAIGFVGSTGRATGPHLHFGLKVLGINANPVSLLNMRMAN